jgi:hypothetical protein
MERFYKAHCRESGLCYSSATFKEWQGALMAHETDYQPGSMDISAHVKAYRGFLSGAKWTFGFIMLAMALLAVFRTHG